MLQIKNLTITHKKDLRTILEHFSFALNPGEKAVIIGEEGNGKSTLLKWIFDPTLIEPYAEAHGERIVSGERLGYLPQELPAVWHSKSVYDFFSDTPLFWEQSPGELGQLSRTLGIPTDFYYSEQSMGSLSGGEKVKAQLARILMEQPTVLLLDEPSNDIDIETLIWLEGFIRNSRQAILYISHDETLIENTADTVIHLEQLRRKTVSRHTVAHMPYVQYVKERNERFANEERHALNDRRQEKLRQEKLNRIQQKVEQDLRSVSRQDPHGGFLLKKKMKSVKSLEHRYERERADMVQLPEPEDSIFVKFGEDIHMPAGKTVLDYHLDRLTVPLPDRIAGSEMRTGILPEESLLTVCPQEDNVRLLARDISLRIQGPKKVCITGRNGIGKTTLLKFIAAQLLPRPDIHAAYMPQDYGDLLDMNATPTEYLSVTGHKDELTRIRTYLGSLKYTADEMERPIAELSGGQKAKLFLLSMSLSGADVLILDEPTRNFSPLSGPVIRKVLHDYGGAVLSISHDRKFIREVCDTVYELTPEGLKESDPVSFS